MTPTPTVPPHVRRGELVEIQRTALENRLEDFHARLLARVRAEAPDLVPKLEKAPPTKDRWGYGLVPTIEPLPEVSATLPSASRAIPARYSWPWTEEKIRAAGQDLDRLVAGVDRSAGTPRSGDEADLPSLVDRWTELTKMQRNIADHARHNRFWQADIARRREWYDRETARHDRVLERQRVRDVLGETDEETFRRRATEVGVDTAGSRAEIEPRLKARERSLDEEIRSAVDAVVPPAFLRVERPSPGRVLLHVPLVTDIPDPGLVEAFRRAVEGIWQASDGRTHYAVRLDIEMRTASDLYRRPPACRPDDAASCQPPQVGAHLDRKAHAARFPDDVARLTTGGSSTHVEFGTVFLGAGAIPARVAAHEFGHVLGFRDAYFRGYRDLGEDGFEVTEIVPEPVDLMASPREGSVPVRYFERLLAALPEAGRASVP